MACDAQVATRDGEVLMRVALCVVPSGGHECTWCAVVERNAASTAQIAPAAIGAAITERWTMVTCSRSFVPHGSIRSERPQPPRAEYRQILRSRCLLSFRGVSRMCHQLSARLALTMLPSSVPRPAVRWHYTYAFSSDRCLRTALDVRIVVIVSRW
jgi:hypothetical protein